MNRFGLPLLLVTISFSAMAAPVADVAAALVSSLSAQGASALRERVQGVWRGFALGKTATQAMRASLSLEDAVAEGTPAGDADAASAGRQAGQLVGMLVGLLLPVGLVLFVRRALRRRQAARGNTPR